MAITLTQVLKANGGDIFTGVVGGLDFGQLPIRTVVLTAKHEGFTTELLPDNRHLIWRDDIEGIFELFETGDGHTRLMAADADDFHNA